MKSKDASASSDILRPAKLFILPSVFLDRQILDWHFIDLPLANCKRKEKEKFVDFEWLWFVEVIETECALVD